VVAASCSAQSSSRRQLLFSTELLFTLTLALAASLACFYTVVPDLRQRIHAILRPAVAAYLVAGVLTSPYLLYALLRFDNRSVNKPALYPADLTSFFIPTGLTALSNAWTRHNGYLMLGNASETGAYLGLPLITIVAWFAWSHRASPKARVLAALIALGVVCDLGTALYVRGSHVVVAPWRVVSGLPLFNNVLPVRFSLYVALASAVVAASWGASKTPSKWVRAGALALAIGVIAPHLWSTAWHSHPHRMHFFVAEIDDHCLRPDETVLVLPFSAVSQAMLWQAEDAYRFRLAEASLSPLVPKDVPERRLVQYITSNDVPPGRGEAILRLARAAGANVILVDRHRGDRWRHLLDETTVQGKRVDGVVLYRLDATLDACA